MPQLASRVTQLQPSATVEISAKAKALQAAGKDIISLSIGVPGFDVPAHIVEAANNAVENHPLSYLPGRGQTELLEAFQTKLQRDGLGDWSTDELCATNGGKNALYLAFQALLENGAKAVVPAPYWVSYSAMIELAGGTFEPLYCGPKQNYKLTPQQLDAALPDATLLVFNNPSNPTGMLYSRDEVAAIGEVLLKQPNVWIVSDDIYDYLTYDGPAATHLLHTHPQLRSRMVITQSISKTYSMPGWRVGMVAAPAELSKSIVKLIGQSLMNINGVAQAAAAAAFAGEHGFLDDVKADFNNKRQYVLKQLAKLNGWACPVPEGAFYVFPNVSNVIGKSYKGTRIENDVQLCSLILEHAEVALIPGSPFGDPNAVRLSYAAPQAKLEQAFQRLAQFMQNVE